MFASHRTRLFCFIIWYLGDKRQTDGLRSHTPQRPNDFWNHQKWKREREKKPHTRVMPPSSNLKPGYWSCLYGGNFYSRIDFGMCGDSPLNRPCERDSVRAAIELLRLLSKSHWWPSLLAERERGERWLMQQTALKHVHKAGHSCAFWTRTFRARHFAAIVVSNYHHTCRFALAKRQREKERDGVFIFYYFQTYHSSHCMDCYVMYAQEVHLTDCCTNKVLC